MFQGSNIVKGSGGLGAAARSNDNVHGMVLGGVLPSSGTYTALNASVRLFQPSDADALGFTAAYDSANHVLVRYHINEYFRLNPNGELWLQIVSQGTTLTNMVTYSQTNGVKKLIYDSGKRVRSVAVALNPATGYTPTITTGFDNDCLTAIGAAQTLSDTFAQQNSFLDMILIEGRLSGTTYAADMRTNTAPNVRMFTGQDSDVAALHALYAAHAGVGTYLGAHGVRRPEEDEGSINSANNPTQGVDTFPINKVGWTNPGLSNGKKMTELTSTQTALLKAQAYLFADSYPEIPGVYMSDSAACVAITSDFAYGVNTRVWNRGARFTAAYLTKKKNSTVATADDGTIAPEVAMEWQAGCTGPQCLGILVKEGSATKVATFLDPAQNIYLSGSLNVQLSIKPFGYARTITGTITLTSSIN